MIAHDFNFGDFFRRAQQGALVLRCGPAAVRVVCQSRKIVQDIHDIYRDYSIEDLDAGGATQSVHIRPTSRWRGVFRPSYEAVADKPGPFAPLPEAIAFVGFEMAQNWQIANTMGQYLLFHAASISASNGDTFLLPGASGSGKSTLGAALGFRGYAFLGDEFALFDLHAQQFQAFPRPISLKNQSIEVMREWLGDGSRISAPFHGTPKGSIAYLRPPEASLRAQDRPTPMAACIFPRFSATEEPSVRRLKPAEAVIEMTAACVNYDKLGTPGFAQIVRWAQEKPVYRIVYPTLGVAKQLVDRIQSQVSEGRDGR